MQGFDREAWWRGDELAVRVLGPHVSWEVSLWVGGREGGRSGSTPLGGSAPTCESGRVISFVVTARDEDPGKLARTVGGVRDACGAAERDVVVVDDGSRSPVGGLPADVTLVRNPRSVGVSGARRLGCELARGDVFVVMDAHLTFGEGWLDALLGAAGAGAVVCGGYWDYERAVHASFGADFRLEAVRDYANGRFPGLQVAPRMQRPPEGVHEVPMLLGGCYLLSRQTYDMLGGFCPLFGSWGVDEQDLSLRAWMSGGRVVCAPEARIGHLTRRSFPYSVTFEDVELNQLVMIRSVFGYRIVEALQGLFEPLSDTVRHRLSSLDLGPWRRRVQRARVWSDEEIMGRLLPEVAALFGAGPALPVIRGQV